MNALTMIVPIDQLIKEYEARTGKKLTKAELAREMVAKGCYKNEKSAVNALAYMEAGKSKGLDYALEVYLCEKFGKRLSEIYYTK